MVTLKDLFDLGEFEEMKNAGFVRVQRHPVFPNELAIANYTHKAQQNYHWNAVTEQTRGLIFHPETLEVVARPFRKFYNHDEKNADPITAQEKVRAFDKLDGSLGIAYMMPDGKWGIATRGSFTSDQAVWATKFYHAKGTEYFPFILMTTDLFEIIYPENRIVVEYAGYEGLVYLGSVDIETGAFRFEYDMFDERAEVVYEGAYENIHTLAERPGKEGVVVCTSDGRRVKVKQEEYVRLHRIVTNLSERAIWEMMEGPYPDRIDNIVSQLPEEHAKWARDVADTLVGQYFMVATKISEVYHSLKGLSTRKEKAIALQNENPVVRAAVFAGLDGKSYVEIVWKALRPTNEGNDLDD